MASRRLARRGLSISGMATATATATFSADQDNAYAGRLGQVDTHYKDPSFGGTEGPPADEFDAQAAPEPEVEPEVEAEPEAEPEPEAAEPEAEPEEVEEIDVESLTVPQLRAQLEVLGVEYAADDRKDDLKALLYEALEEG